MTSRPTNCPRCKKYFTEPIQAEARMIILREGESAGRTFVDEKLEPFHEGHDQEEPYEQ